MKTGTLLTHKIKANVECKTIEFPEMDFLGLLLASTHKLNQSCIAFL